jgi:hypothetical protein
MGKKKTTAKSKNIISRGNYQYGLRIVAGSNKHYLALALFTAIDFAGLWIKKNM